MTSDADERLRGGNLARGTFRGRPRRLARAALLRMLRPVLRLTIEGLEHVPPDGGLLVVANHLHNADPILLSIAFPRPLHFMAKKELFGLPVIGWVIRRVGAFPVDRGKADRGALRHAESLLAQGIAVGMFPEGTRSTTGGLGPALPGAALLALRARVPVLPVTIVGSERLPFRGTKASEREESPKPSKRVRRLTIRIGPPFSLPTSTNDRKTSVSESSDALMERLAEMLPAEYRGYYGDRRAVSRAERASGR